MNGLGGETDSEGAGEQGGSDMRAHGNELRAADGKRRRTQGSCQPTAKGGRADPRTRSVGRAREAWLRRRRSARGRRRQAPARPKGASGPDGRRTTIVGSPSVVRRRCEPRWWQTPAPEICWPGCQIAAGASNDVVKVPTRAFASPDCGPLPRCQPPSHLTQPIGSSDVSHDSQAPLPRRSIGRVPDPRRVRVRSESRHQLQLRSWQHGLLFGLRILGKQQLVRR